MRYEISYNYNIRTHLKEKRTRRRKLIRVLKPSAEKLFNEVCYVLDENTEEVAGKCRVAHLVKARAVFSYLGEGFGFSLAEVGKCMGRDHTTVIHHQKTYTRYLDKSKPYYNPKIEDEVREVKRRLKNRLISCE